MFTNTIRKIASKIVMATMLFSVIAPMGSSLTAADGPVGNLKVGFNHVDGGYTITNVQQQIVADRGSGDCPLQNSGPYMGYFFCQENLPIGTYTVTFDSVTDMVTPNVAHVNLNETGADIFGDYVAEGVQDSGVLGINVNHVDAGYIVKNVQQQTVTDVDVSQCGPLQQNGYYLCSQSLPVGTYTVEFKDLQGFDKPNDANINLTVNGDTLWADYTAQGPSTGLLAVGINHVDGGYTIEDVQQQQVADVNASSCGPLNQNGYYMCTQSLPIGTYTVKFKTVQGFNKPADINLNLNTQGGTVWGTYTSQGPAQGNLIVGVNLAEGGFTIENVQQQQVADVDPVSMCGAPVNGYYMCDQYLPIGTYTVKFKTVGGYNKPADIHVNLDEIGGTVWGYYSTLPTGVIQVKVVDQNNQPILNLPANEWQMKRCTTANPGSCTDVMATGGSGGVYDNLSFFTYRIVFPNPQIPNGYSGRTVLPNVYQVLDAQHTSLIFVIKYTQESQGGGDAYVNVQTTPVMASVRMTKTDPQPQSIQNGVTSDTNPAPYDLAPADRFTLPTLNGGVTAQTDYYIECLPAPGVNGQAYAAPANPINVTNAVYAAGSENLAGVCQYTQVPPTDQVTITIDTINVLDAAIFVDGVPVRPNGQSGVVQVVITTTEDHTISFEQNPANNPNITGHTPPDDIAIPAGTLNSSMTGTDLVNYLGYYVLNGNLAVAEVNTENQNGWAYITVGNDPTMWNVGYADTTATALYVQFDQTVEHEFHFQDRNTAYYLRAVPVTDTNTPGFAVSQAGGVTDDGNGNITHFQEHYTYDGLQILSTNVQLVGDYISENDAAFFRARTTNANPIFGKIYLDINGEPQEVLNPGAQTWTRVFISDVTNDTDTTSFEPTIIVNSVLYTANPLNFNLGNGNYVPGPNINNLESEYVEGGSTDLTVQLIPAGVGSAGLTVLLDSVLDQQTANVGGTFQTTYVNVDPNVNHTVDCPDVPNYVTNNLFIGTGLLTPGVENFAYCIYTPLPTAAEILIETEAWDDVDFPAPITLNINGTDFNLGFTLSDGNPATPATLSRWIDTADTNTITYGSMSGYDAPAPVAINVAPGSSWQTTPIPNTFNGLYTNPGGTGADLTFHLRELDPNGGPVAATDVTVVATTQQSDSNGDTTFNDVAVNQVINVTFGDHPLGSGAYATPLALTFQSGELVDGQAYDFYIYYVPVGNAVTLDVETLDEATQLINVNGAIYLVVNGSQSTLYGYGTASIIVSNDTQYSYQIDWGPATLSGYIEPAVDPLTVDVSGLSAGQHMDVDGLYRLCVSGNCEVVTITAYDENNAILTSVDITVNGNVVSTTGFHTGTYDVGAVLNVEFEDVPTHDVPEIEVNSVSIGNTHTTTYTVLDNPSPNTVEAFYDLDGNSVGFNVATQDNQGDPFLNPVQTITHGVNGTENNVATPASFAVDKNDLTTYTINFDDRPGYITPNPVVVAGQAIAVVPANVTITNNGTGLPYVAGSQLVLGNTYNIVATYEPHFVIEKNVTNEQTIANNNKRVDYEIVVTLHPDAPSNMSITLHDTISDNARTLTGTNGGTMTVVPENGNYSDCSNNCGDITAGSVVVNIDTPGTPVTITYQLLSNNSGIPANNSSTFTNTLTGSYDDNGQPVEVTTDAAVNVLAPPGGGSTPPSGGGGGGGGVILVRGDMVLEVTKLVSLDNRNFVDASDEDDPLAIPERVDSTIFTKVNVKNLGQVSATNIKYSEGFDEGDSKITSDDITNVEGEEGFSYNDVTGVMTIDKIIVGGEINFTYEQIVHENGSQGELAEEYLVLEGFSTKLKVNQDGLTKHGIGDHYPSWLVAGEPTVVSDGDLLQLSIKTDKAAARVGEEVTYTITARNNADFDFSGLVITWNYDENAFEILNPFGGRDNGTEIHWDRGILRPGQTVEYHVRTRVSDTAPVGGNVRTTARGLVNEIENPAVVDHFLTIIAGISPGPIDLAQTGMPTFMLILASMFAYLTYTQTGRRRYLALKKAALRPI